MGDMVWYLAAVLILVCAGATAALIGQRMGYRQGRELARVLLEAMRGHDPFETAEVKEDIQEDTE